MCNSLSFALCVNLKFTQYVLLDTSLNTSTHNTREGLPPESYETVYVQSFTEFVLQIFSTSIFFLLCLTLLPTTDNFIAAYTRAFSDIACIVRVQGTNDVSLTPPPPNPTTPLLNLPSLNRLNRVLTTFNRFFVYQATWPQQHILT